MAIFYQTSSDGNNPTTPVGAVWSRSTLVVQAGYPDILGKNQISFLTAKSNSMHSQNGKCYSIKRINI